MKGGAEYRAFDSIDNKLNSGRGWFVDSGTLVNGVIAASNQAYDRICSIIDDVSVQ